MHKWFNFYDLATKTPHSKHEFNANLWSYNYILQLLIKYVPYADHIFNGNLNACPSMCFCLTIPFWRKGLLEHTYLSWLFWFNMGRVHLAPVCPSILYKIPKYQHGTCSITETKEDNKLNYTANMICCNQIRRIPMYCEDLTRGLVTSCSDRNIDNIDPCDGLLPEKTRPYNVPVFTSHW